MRTGKIPHRKNSLEPDGWAVAAMSGAIAQRVADTAQALRAACEWSKGGAKRWFEERKPFAAYVRSGTECFGKEPGRETWSGTSTQGYR